MADAVDDPPDEEAHHDEETALWDDGWDTTRPVETWKFGRERRTLYSTITLTGRTRVKVNQISGGGRRKDP